jgi:hypothetical protein
VSDPRVILMFGMGKPTSNILDRAVRRDDCREAILGIRGERRRIDVFLARQFYEVDRSIHYVYEQCSSVHQFGEKHGFSSQEAGTLAAAGKSLELVPELEARLLAGRITLDAAAALAKVFENPELMRDGDDWLGKAEKQTLKALRRDIRERIAEVRADGPASSLEITLSSKGREDFERARQIACEKKNRILDEGETVEVLADHYLDSFDEDRRKPAARRMADTSASGGNGIPSGRTIPAEVRREVFLRGDPNRKKPVHKCQFPNCERTMYLQFCHREPHAHGGGREADNILLLCRIHHTLLDEGEIRAEGPADDPTFYERVDTEFGEGWLKVLSARAPP